MNNSVSISFILLFRNLKQKSPIICFAKTISHTGGYLFYLHKTIPYKKSRQKKISSACSRIAFVLQCH